MGAYSKANDLAILAGARKPQWAEQAVAAMAGAGTNGKPDSASDGVYLENSLHALLAVEMREEAHRRTARVTVGTLDLAANYTITINGTACTANGPFADRAEVINDLVTAINGSGIAAVVTASAVDEDSGVAGVETVKIVGDADTQWTIAISATGTGVLACIADPDSATMRLWFVARESDAPAAWVKVNSGTVDIDEDGFLERVESAGLDRLYVELHTVDGTGDGASITYRPTIKIGPCVAE